MANFVGCDVNKIRGARSQFISDFPAPDVERFRITEFCPHFGLVDTVAIGIGTGNRVGELRHLGKPILTQGCVQHEQDLDELAQGFNNEVAPTVLKASGKVFRLTGTLDSQYREWRAILREIFSLETGLPTAPGVDVTPTEGLP